MPAPANDGSVVPLSDEKSALEILTQSVMGLWDTVNNLTHLRPTKRDCHRVTMFGSARIDPNHWVYAAVRDTAAGLTRLGCDIITGGGPGLMQATNEGVKIADPDGVKQKSVGICGPALRAGCERVRYGSVRTQDLLHAPAPVRSGVGRVCRLPWWHRHRAGNADGLATASSPTLARHSVDSRRAFLGWIDRLGRQSDAHERRVAHQPVRPENPTDPRRWSGDCPGDPSASFTLESATRLSKSQSRSPGDN